MKPLELYLHIPFCIQKCNYCDFLSAPSCAGERKIYVESLCQKIRSYKDLAKAYHVVSIFVGGGTPSLLLSKQIEQIFEAVRETFVIDSDAEISLEANPGTVTEEKLQAYRNCGINRLSIGLQSAKDRELKRLGRIHTYEEFLWTYELARKAGFLNINVDLMSGIPLQTLADWEETLHEVARLKPEHISAYSLIVEEGTPFYERYGNGKHLEELPDEETERKMYYRTREILESYGYHRYEISNYARLGYECRHNLGYWNRTEYLGIGTGAASLIREERWNEGEIPEKLDRKAQMEETMFLGLRTMKGVSKAEFAKTYQQTMESVYGKVLEEMQKKGLLLVGEDQVCLTDAGIDVSNYVMSEFLL